MTDSPQLTVWAYLGDLEDDGVTNPLNKPSGVSSLPGWMLMSKQLVGDSKDCVQAWQLPKILGVLLDSCYWAASVV